MRIVIHFIDSKLNQEHIIPPIQQQCKEDIITIINNDKEEITSSSSSTKKYYNNTNGVLNNIFYELFSLTTSIEEKTSKSSNNTFKHFKLKSHEYTSENSISNNDTNDSNHHSDDDNDDDDKLYESNLMKDIIKQISIVNNKSLEYTYRHDIIFDINEKYMHKNIDNIIIRLLKLMVSQIKDSIITITSNDSITTSTTTTTTNSNTTNTKEENDIYLSSIYNELRIIEENLRDSKPILHIQFFLHEMIDTNDIIESNYNFDEIDFYYMVDKLSCYIELNSSPLLLSTTIMKQNSTSNPSIPNTTNSNSSTMKMNERIYLDFFTNYLSLLQLNDLF
jgi:hypothetical protein